MTALGRAPGLEQDMGELAALPGLEMVAGQIAPLIAVLRAEQARRQAGIEIRRPAWKNLVFTGGPGTGKSRAARAVAHLYQQLGLLTYGKLTEIDAADLAGATPRDTAVQVAGAVRPAGDVLMITGAHAWHALPGHGQHLLRCLYQVMTHEHRHRRDDELVLILAGQAGRCATCWPPPRRWPPGSRPSSTSPATPQPSSPASSLPWPARPDSPSPLTP